MLAKKLIVFVLIWVPKKKKELKEGQLSYEIHFILFSAQEKHVLQEVSQARQFFRVRHVSNVNIQSCRTFVCCRITNKNNFEAIG